MPYVDSADLAGSGTGPVQGSALVGFKSAGSNSVLRTVESRLRETVSVMDFGAAGDGTTDDTIAINFAIASLAPGKTLYFPAGNYPVSVTSGEMSIAAIPVGANVFMEPNAWLKLNPADAVITAFVPLGQNVLTVNVDGQSLTGGTSGKEVDTGTWSNASHGIRAYGDASLGIGAANVSVLNSRFENLRYAIQTEGAQGWHIHGNRFERTKYSAILMGAGTGRSCSHNTIANNHFEDIGDYACSFYEISGNTTGQSCFNSIIGNTAIACNIFSDMSAVPPEIANGHAFGWELGQVGLQHHNLIANNVYDRQRADIIHNRGLAVLGTNSFSTVIGNIAKGSGATSSADEAITCLNSKHCRIASNSVSDFRGSGINVDGGDNIAIDGNTVTDCGGSGNAYPVMFGRNFGGRSIGIRNNRVITTSSFPSYADGVPSIGGIGTSAYQLRDITIRSNDIDRPIDVGISVLGDPSLPPTNIVIDANTITAREFEDPASAFFEGYPVVVRYSNSVSITRNHIYNAKHGIYARENDKVTLRDNEFVGTQALDFCLWADGSSNINSNGNVVRVAVTDLLNGFPPTSYTNAYFGPTDALFPLQNAATDSAAASAGVAVGMQYRNGSLMMVRVS